MLSALVVATVSRGCDFKLYVNHRVRKLFPLEPADDAQQLILWKLQMPSDTPIIVGIPTP
jgi:hypothetical protein